MAKRLSKQERAIRDLQHEFMAAELSDNPREAYREYEANVDLFAGNFGIDFKEAFEMIERGPLL